MAKPKSSEVQDETEPKLVVAFLAGVFSTANQY